MTRLAPLLALVVACSSGKPDRAAGKYRSADGKGPVFELRADGSLDIDPVTDDRCHDAPNLAACRAKQRWSRDGSKLTLERAALATRQGPGSSLGLGPDGDICHCTLERTEATFDADTISIGRARAVRVR